MSRSNRKNQNPRNHKRRNQNRKTGRKVGNSGNAYPIAPSTLAAKDDGGGAVAHQKKSDSGAEPSVQENPPKLTGRRGPSFVETGRFLYAICELLIAAAIAYFAWVQSTVSELQLRAMREQNDAISRQLDELREQGSMARDQLEAIQIQSGAAVAAANAAKEGNTAYTASVRQSLRAYVFLGTCTLTIDQNKREVVVNLEHRNNGATPAHKITTHLCAFAESREFTGPWVHQRTIAVDGQEISVGPDRDWLVIAKPELSAPDFESVVNGTKIIWVFGCIEYEDAFCEKRVTNFRFSQGDIIPQVLPVPGIDSYHLNFRDKGNDSN